MDVDTVIGAAFYQTTHLKLGLKENFITNTKEIVGIIKICCANKPFVCILPSKFIIKQIDDTHTFV
jgi:hypothetical protein